MTTRTLVILRHAKAERPAGLADLDRPLTQRGHADAAAAGAWLVANGYRPDLVVCSPARRTRQTWHGIAIALGRVDAPEVRYEMSVYSAAAEDLFELLGAVPVDRRTVLLVGHNPAMSIMSAALDQAGAGDSDGLRTSGLAVYAVDGPWATVGPGTGRLLAAHTARA
jgi:phosphohistidine phosphatase